MAITSENRSQLNLSNYYDTSLRDFPGPKRTFEGGANTGNRLPYLAGRIRMNLSTEPVGLEKFYESPRAQRVGLYASGIGLYALSALEGGSSLWQSSTQIAERLVEGRTNVSAETYLAFQFSTILSMIILSKFAGYAIKRARRTRIG